MSRAIKIVKDEETQVPVEVMEQAIVDIGLAMKRISASRLNRKALIILIAHDSRKPQYVVASVLESLENLEAAYLNKKTRK